MQKKCWTSVGTDYLIKDQNLERNSKAYINDLPLSQIINKKITTIKTHQTNKKMISKIMTLALAPIVMAATEIYNINDADLSKTLDLSFGTES